MTRIGCIFLTLACAACTAAPPFRHSVAPGEGIPATSANSAPTASDEEKNGPLGIEAAAILKKMPTSGSQKATGDLKASYPDKEAFLADVKANHPPHAIALDDDTIWQGFGPAARYHTNKDGSISR